MIGQEITNVTLTANTETTIEYPSAIQLADIQNQGPGDVYLSWRKTAMIGDANCIRLIAGDSYEIRSSGPFTKISFISVGTPFVQAVTR